MSSKAENSRITMGSNSNNVNVKMHDKGLAHNPAVTLEWTGTAPLSHRCKISPDKNFDGVILGIP